MCSNGTTPTSPNLARIELTALVGLPLDTVAERVTQWDRALPQYRVGHVDLVSRAREALQDDADPCVGRSGFPGSGSRPALPPGSGGSTGIPCGPRTGGKATQRACLRRANPRPVI